MEPTISIQINEGLAILSRIFWIVGGILTSCMVIVFLFGLYNLITCLTFPEKVIFNTIQSML